MTVYVDDALIEARVGNFVSKWSHLMADSTEELTAFAMGLGLRASWIQYRGTPKEHFDLTSGKRWQAIRRGAVEIAYGHEGAALMKAKRDGVPFDLAAFRSSRSCAGEPPSAPRTPAG